MFNFSIIVIKKLLKVLAAFVRSINFSPFASKVGTVPLNVLKLFLS